MCDYFVLDVNTGNMAQQSILLPVKSVGRQGTHTQE
jgi:hypothetical protein